MTEKPADWASILALDLMSIVLGNPYRISHQLVAEHLREVEARGALRGAHDMANHVHAKLDSWLPAVADELEERIHQ